MKPTAVTEKRKDKIPYEHYSNLLKEYDPYKIETKSGYKYDENNKTFNVQLLDDLYLVKYPCGSITKYGNETEDIKYSIKTIILRYLMNAKNVAPTGKNITYRDISGGDVYYPSFYGRCIIRLCKTFKNSFAPFKKAMELLKAKKMDLGDLSYQIEFMNNILVTIIVWNGDEEFSSSAQILFDSNISFYFTAEDIAVMGDIIMSKITQYAYSK